LNFVFNHYDGKRLFADVVQQAQDEGYTEPDPRLDLSGKDVMRKIMILARETGEKIEMDDIENSSFMPESCMQGSVENFYAEMRKHEAHFKSYTRMPRKIIANSNLLLLIVIHLH
jgi:aspartokinase/homoserine dehydrogenase 1